MLFRSCGILLLLFCGLLSGAEKPREQIVEYTKTKPCHLDKYKYFCCPIAKMVRRGSTEKSWTDYFYNDRNDLIGLRKSNYSGNVHKSTFTAFCSNCSRCGSTQNQIKVHKWNHDTTPKLDAPKKRKKK